MVTFFEEKGQKIPIGHESLMSYGILCLFLQDNKTEQTHKLFILSPQQYASYTRTAS